MSYLYRKLVLSSLVFLAAMASFVCADENNVRTFDNYEVHYSVFNSSFLTPEVAESYNIVRSKSQALMNISVLEKLPDGSKRSTSAIVTGEQYDLIRHEPLKFSEIKEQETRYYLSSFEITNKTTIYFTVYIQLAPNHEPYKLQFNKLLYKDE